MTQENSEETIYNPYNENNKEIISLYYKKNIRRT